MTSAKSMKSTTMTMSLRSLGSVDNVVDDNRPHFEVFFPNTCRRFSCPVDIAVRKEFQRDGFLRALKAEQKTAYKKINVHDHRTTSKAVSAMKQSQFVVPSIQLTYGENTVVLTAIYDNMNRFVEISLNKVPHIPRSLMQCITLSTPFFENLFKISITRCGIDVYTLHELCKFLRSTTVSDVCLDDSPLVQGNYSILLEKPTRVKYLSLSRCLVNDKVCSQLTSQINFPHEAETNLTVLNLASNRITDTGARCIGTALRSNRHLRYVNLSDNKLTDVGASCILDALLEFPMTAEEIEGRRQRYMTYEKTRLELFESILKEMEMLSRSYQDIESNIRKQKKPKKNFASPIRRKSSPSKLGISCTLSVEDVHESTQKRAQMRASEELGPFVDPFSNVIKKNDWVFSSGNFILSYLNLAYNNLTYASVKKISKVLMYQSIHARMSETGLLKVLLEGNNMPATCPELVDIQNLLNKNVSRFAGTVKTVETKRKSKAKISVTTDVGVDAYNTENAIMHRGHK